jgi:hypothetical protein
VKRFVSALILLALAGVASAENGARYLIITHDNFVQTIQPLAQWKTQKGMLAKVVPLSVTGSSATQIRAYIQNAYNTWPVRPEYVLVVGAPDLLPASLSSPGDGTDDAYGDMSGTYEIEIPVGRFFCDNAGECSTLVTKSLTYEKTPYASGDSTWMRRGTTLIREDNPPDSYYQADCRYIRGLWSGAGYLQTESLISTYNNSTDVRNAINAGRGLVIHRGQCVGNWWSPFDQVSPATLSNGAMLPVVVSGSCQTLTLASGSTMLADQFVRAGTAQTLRGAVAYFGTGSIGSHISLQRGTVSKGFFTAVFAEGRYKLGDACKRGKFYLDSLVPGNQTYYQEWILLGDPELPLWTDKPGPLVAAYDSAVPLGPYTMNVHVTRDGSPAAGALVCAMMDTSVYVYGTTDAQGDVSLNFTTLHIGTMSLTATARNCLPCENTVQVFAGNMPYVSLQRTLIDDAGGNGNGLINPGEPIRLRVGLKNSGDSTAFAVTAGLSSADSFATVTDSQQAYGDIAAHDSAWSTGFYAFTVAQSCTSGQSLNFTLHIRDSHARLWTSSLTLPVYAAAINYDANLINDPPPGGNGNSQLDPHENVRLIVNLRNLGTEELSGVRATLRCASSHISISDSTGFYGDIPVGLSASNGQNPFALSTSPNLPAAPIAFTLDISGNGGTYSYHHLQQFTIVPNGTGGPIGPDPYGYYCYDDADTLSGRAPVFSWLELASPGPGSLISGITDSDMGLDTLVLPFAFKFYGSNFDTITVASNGFAAFGKTPNRGSNNSHIPSADSARYRNLLPMWDDLNPDQNNGGHGDIYQYYDAANHRWIEEFYQVPHYWNVNLQETFQLILLDPAYYPTPTGDGEILFQYQIVADPNYATVGIQDPTWTRAIQYECNGVYDANAATIVNSRAVRFTTLPPLASSREWLTLAGIGLDDSTHGNGNHVAEPGEEILLTTFLTNQGEAAASSVQGTLRSSDGNSTVIDSVSDFGGIPAHGQANNGTDPFDVQIAGQPSESLAQFTLLVTSAASSSALYFTLPLGNVSGVLNRDLNRLARFVLSGYPNPARAAVGVRYGLPRAADVSLGVFDMSGRLVRTLVQSRTAPGWHELRWDGNDATGRRAAAGVYFLRLNAVDAGQVRQLVQKLEIVR